MSWLARTCSARGWTPATAGNFSARADAHWAAISMSGVDKGALTPEQALPMPLEGPLPPKSSAEAPLHRALYRRFPHVQAVAHIHSIPTTLASLHWERAGRVRFEGLELIKAFAGFQTHETVVDATVIPNTQDMDGLGEQVATGDLLIGGAPALLLAGHGAYVWGRDRAETIRHLEALDFMLTVLLHREGAYR